METQPHADGDERGFMSRPNFDLPILRESPEGVLLQVQAQPGSRQNQIRGLERDRLKVAVTQVAEKGKATKAILALIADWLEIPRSHVELVIGETQRMKTVLLRGQSLADIQRRLEQKASNASDP
jgi:hypothetical protein